MNFSFTLNVVKIQIFAIFFGVFLFSLSYSAYTYASSAITEINVNQVFNSTQVIAEETQLYNSVHKVSVKAEPLRTPRIVILKGRRELLLYNDTDLYKSYPMGLGFAPNGDKEIQGDGKTPLGFFRVRIMNEQSSFHLSLGLDYPTIEDATRGFMNDLIGFQEYVDIINAINHHQMPPQETKLGGNIYIHGNGSDDDWTKGCIALENRDIEELFSLVGLGTPVTIKP